MVEIGGTVGDIESQPFLEAIRQFKLEAGHGNAINVHLTYVPYIKAAGELKSKPTQHSVKELRALGIQPDVLLCRADLDLPRSLRDKIALFCSVTPDAVFCCRDASTIYEVPLNLHLEGLDAKVAGLLNLGDRRPDLSRLARPAAPDPEPRGQRAHRHRGQVRGVQGELQVPDRGPAPRRLRPERPRWTSSGSRARSWSTATRPRPGGLPRASWCRAGSACAAPGHDQGHPYARENRMPFFGICLGMQMARWSSPATWSGWRGPIPPSSRRPQAPGDLQAAGAGGRGGAGRHHAPGRLPLRAGGGQPGRPGLRHA